MIADSNAVECMILEKSLKTQNDILNKSYIKRANKFRKAKNRKNKNEKTDRIEETNLGRKKKNDITKGKHNKYAPDNIIKKCKRIFFKYINIYINLIIKKYRKENFEFKNLSYENYIKNLKKKNEMKLLEMPLKDFVSLDIISNLGLNVDFNLQKMEKILEEEKDNQELIPLLNMTLEEQINVFNFKKKIAPDIEFNGLKEVILDLYDKENYEYFSRLIFYYSIIKIDSEI